MSKIKRCKFGISYDYKDSSCRKLSSIASDGSAWISSNVNYENIAMKFLDIDYTTQKIDVMSLISILIHFLVYSYLSLRLSFYEIAINKWSLNKSWWNILIHVNHKSCVVICVQTDFKPTERFVEIVWSINRSTVSPWDVRVHNFRRQTTY